MKEHPIVFSAPMVQAILAGRKTQTRRVIKPQPIATPTRLITFEDGQTAFSPRPTAECSRDDITFCPYGKIGDRLWVRETFQTIDETPFFHRVYYRATDTDNNIVKWQPSIHMPRALSRILLEITDVHIQRLQDISEDDIKAEGVPARGNRRDDFIELWDNINGKKVGCSWDDNPWIWVITFRKIQP
ncbi:MAG: hypothetical protein LBS40_01050 [Burkholderiales bacterium]|jgi:hypothetical protein|nr:hypothetical protein [Burkholderiales bacterium]